MQTKDALRFVGNLCQGSNGSRSHSEVESWTVSNEETLAQMMETHFQGIAKDEYVPSNHTKLQGLTDNPTVMLKKASDIPAPRFTKAAC